MSLRGSNTVKSEDTAPESVDARREVRQIPDADAVDRERSTLVHDSQGLTMATWKNVALHVWTAQATPVVVDALDGLSAAFTSTHPEGVSAVHILANGIPLPEADVRERLRQVTSRYAEHLGCVCHVVEGSGFWASALHSFLTGLHLLARGPFRLHICSDIAAAARWVPGPHMRRTNVSIVSAELEEALTDLRRTAKTP
jgi:hypothetical protein